MPVKKKNTLRKPASDRILEVAAELFYLKGIRSVGVEEIVQIAGVAKISLYRSFPSKDALIVAYLETRSITFLEHWDKTFGERHDDPRTTLRSIMSFISDRTTTIGYLGCPFINFCAEFRDPDHPGRKVAEATKRALRTRFLQLAREFGVPRPSELADGFLLLLEGAYAISQTLGGGQDSPGKALVWAAEALVDAQLKGVQCMEVAG